METTLKLRVTERDIRLETHSSLERQRDIRFETHSSLE